MSELALPVDDLEPDLDLGHGFKANWITDGDNKVGIQLMHSCGLAPLFWEHVGVYQPMFELEHVDPLTLTPHVACPECMAKGWIRLGRWVPYDDRPSAEACEAIAAQIAHEFRHFATADWSNWLLAAESVLIKARESGWKMVPVAEDAEL